ncbi:MAG: hypothetical protein AB7S38_35655 [Vulcanimicrobiota bacterium]
MLEVYNAFGLALGLDWSSQRLTPTDTAPDWTVRRGPVPRRLPGGRRHGPLWETSDGLLLLHVPKVARYLIRPNHQVTVESEAEVTSQDIETFLLGNVLGVLLTLSGRAVLQASAVVGPSGGMIFVGISGAGKSTLIDLLHQQGCDFISDELVVLAENRLVPGPPYITLGRPRGSDWLVRRPNLARHLKPARPGTPVLVRRVYDLSLWNGEQISLTRSSRREGLEVLLRYTPSRSGLRALGLMSENFRQASHLAGSDLEFWRARVPAGRLPELAERIRS